MRTTLLLALLAIAACTEHEPTAYVEPTADAYDGNYFMRFFGGFSPEDLADAFGDDLAGLCIHSNLKLTATDAASGTAEMGFALTQRVATLCERATQADLFQLSKGTFRVAGDYIAIAIDSTASFDEDTDALGSFESDRTEMAGQRIIVQGENKQQVELLLPDVWEFNPGSSTSGGKVSTGTGGGGLGRGGAFAGRIVFEKAQS